MTTAPATEVRTSLSHQYPRLAPAALSTRVWRALASTATVLLVSAAVILGVSIGIQAPDVSPVEPDAAAASAADPAPDPALDTRGGDGVGPSDGQRDGAQRDSDQRDGDQRDGDEREGGPRGGDRP